MIAKEKSPFSVTLDGRKIEHFLNRRKFDEAAEGWYYSQTKKAVEVKYANPGKDYNPVSYTHLTRGRGAPGWHRAPGPALPW